MKELLVLATEKGVVVARRLDEDWVAEERTLTGRSVTSVIAREGVILAGTTDGIWRSTDLGATWQPAANGLGHRHVRWLAFHPDVSDCEFAGMEPAALYRSTDGGDNWLPAPEVDILRDRLRWFLPYSPEAGCVRGFAFHGRRGYAAVEVGGLLRSDDAGVTWRLPGGSSGVPRFGTPPADQIHPDVHDVVVAPDDPDRVYAPTGGGIYRSLDGGERWTRIYACPYARALWVDPLAPRRLVAGPAGGVGRQGTVALSTDGGDSWREASSGLQTPWPATMVERFVVAGEDLVAILDDGTLRAAPRATLQWRPVLPELPYVRAAWSLVA